MTYREILEHLAAYPAPDDPHGQVDRIIVDRLNKVLEQETIKAVEIKQILDDAIFSSLVSDLVAYALETVWLELISEEEKNK